MWCVQRRACPRPLHLNLFTPPLTPLINYDHWKTFRHSLTVANDQDFLGFFGSLPPGGLEVSHALEVVPWGKVPWFPTRQQ